MTRIIAGSAKGRRLLVPSSGTRPTADRVRESMFARLESWDAVVGARVLDLFAGSGALGLEALSRGAQSATFVEKSSAACRVISTNARAIGVGNRCAIEKLSVARFLGEPEHDHLFDLVFIDPPYALNDEELAGYAEALVPLLTSDATLVFERDGRAETPVLPRDLEILRQSKWGDTAAWFVGVNQGET